MKQNTWKTLAIIFMMLFVIETICVVLLFGIGANIIDNEYDCSINICGEQKYDAYFYDEFNKICYCYKDNEILYQEYLGK